MQRRTRGIMAGVIALGLLVGVWTAGALAARPAPAPADTVSHVLTNPLVRTAVKSDTSPPLREMPVVPPVYNMALHAPEHARLRPRTGPAPGPDGALQPLLGPLVMPTPSASFEGMYNYWGGYPPDTNGDVGRNHYVQIVNVGFQIFNKSTGASLYGPASSNTLWRGFGGPCEARNDGDPIALYDAQADRWLLSQFTSSAPYYQCMALSTSGDPTGSYYRYAFFESNNALGDYPHLGVWPDAYYMTTNEFGSANGGGNYAFERARMIQGDPGARMVYFGSADGGLLPSDLDGPAPPAGSPNFFMEWSDTSHLAEFKFHVDWTTPANSTFTGPIQIAVTPFNLPNGIPQPGTNVRLDDLSDRLMYRLAYRNLGAYEALVVDHTVDAGGGVAGIRWYEVRSPNATPTLFQQGTFAPDTTQRWMGSTAMDSQGNIAVLYSASSSTVFPSIRYAGRLVSDPPGQLSQGEATLIAGAGSQTGPGARWGDYAMLSVDPSDDCTFWGTTEYIQVTGERTWRTRIGAFKFPNCAAATPPPVASATGTPPTATRTPGATSTPCAGSISATGSITNTDAMQTSRLASVGQLPSSCAFPKACPGNDTGDTTVHHYDSYTYVNSTGAPQCVTVNLVPACSNNALISVAYQGSYDPANKCTNYLADGGRGGPNYTYSFTLPAGQTAVVIVYEQNGGVGCESYTININPCSTGGGTVTPGPTGTATPPATSTSTPVPTNTPGAGASPTATATVCPITFTDVDVNNPFYSFIRCLACRQIVSGYSDGTFRWGNQVTRGQLSKIIAGAAGFTDAIPSGQQTFEDVPPSNAFWLFIERLVAHQAISGYACGGAGEPCVPPGLRPYFRWSANATRGQIAKIDAIAAGYADVIPTTRQTFEDVPSSNPFWLWIEELSSRSIISGYTCGGVGEPCVPPGNRPYFRWTADATRGQMSKIAAQTFFPGCSTPGRK